MPRQIVSACLLLLIVASCGQPEQVTVTKARNPKQYSIEQLYNNQAVSGAGFNDDETKILTQNNSTGIFNVYELNIADSQSTPLTTSKKESFFAVTYLPGGGQFIYSSDKGGDENSHLYLLHKGDTAAKDLTPWPKSANRFAGRGLGKRLGVRL